MLACPSFTKDCPKRTRYYAVPRQAAEIQRTYEEATRKGEPCRAAATAGGLCFFHANPDKASELGRIGGRSNRHAASEITDPLPTLDSALAVRETGARLINDLVAGRIQPRVASVLVSLLSLQLRSIETTNLEVRVAALEKVFKEEDDRSK